MPEPSSHSFKSRGLRLHYSDWGHTDAAPLLLIHGGRDHCRSWDWVAERLRQKWHIIAPDLRGHGDSDWSPDGDYSTSAFIYDLAALIAHLNFDKVTIVGHSFGGHVALGYTSLYPARVQKLVAIEGLGPSPKMLAERDATPIDQHLRTWIEQFRIAEQRLPRRYPSIAAALDRMMQENKHLSVAQARHLTVHGLRQNEDGTLSWKFDNTLHVRMPVEITTAQQHYLWQQISCPTLLVYGAESWASNPATDGRAAHFRTAKVSLYERAGHWVHHDRLDAFVDELQEFL